MKSNESKSNESKSNVLDLESTEKELSKLLIQSNELDAILLKLMRCAKFDTNKPSHTNTNTPDVVGDDLTKTAIFPDAPQINFRQET